jgi:hypothetical protein
MKQYKILKEHCMRRTSKPEQKAMLTKLKEDQDRRVAMLAEQYNHSMSEVRKHQTVSFISFLYDEMHDGQLECSCFVFVFFFALTAVKRHS